MRVCPRCAHRFDRSWTCAACQWRPSERNGIQQIAPDAATGIEGYAASLFDDLRAAEQTHFWFSARASLLAWTVARYFPRAETLHEAGCGTGNVLAGLRRRHPHLHLSGSEAFLEALLPAAEALSGVELVQADIRALPFDAEFDVVGAFDVLEHVPDHEAVMQQLVRATKPGGGVIVTVPQHQRLWSRFDDYAGHQRRYSRRELVDLIEGADLRVERVTSFVSLLLPAVWASRLALDRNSDDPTSEYCISPLTNRIGRAVMSVERALIRAGMSFPAGGSLLAVARRVT